MLQMTRRTCYACFVYSHFLNLFNGPICISYIYIQRTLEKKCLCIWCRCRSTTSLWWKRSTIMWPQRKLSLLGLLMSKRRLNLEMTKSCPWVALSLHLPEAELKVRNLHPVSKEPGHVPVRSRASQTNPHINQYTLLVCMHATILLYSKQTAPTVRSCFIWRPKPGLPECERIRKKEKIWRCHLGLRSWWIPNPWMIWQTFSSKSTLIRTDLSSVRWLTLDVLLRMYVLCIQFFNIHNRSGRMPSSTSWRLYSQSLLRLRSPVTRDGIRKKIWLKNWSGVSHWTQAYEIDTWMTNTFEGGH